MTSPWHHFAALRDEMLQRLRPHMAVESDLRFWVFTEMDAYAKEVFDAFGLDAYGFDLCEQAYLAVVRLLVENERAAAASAFVDEFRDRAYVNVPEAQRIIARD